MKFLSAVNSSTLAQNSDHLVHLEGYSIYLFLSKNLIPKKICIIGNATKSPNLTIKLIPLMVSVANMTAEA